MPETQRQVRGTVSKRFRQESALRRLSLPYAGASSNRSGITMIASWRESRKSFGRCPDLRACGCRLARPPPWRGLNGNALAQANGRNGRSSCPTSRGDKVRVNLVYCCWRMLRWHLYALTGATLYNVAQPRQAYPGQ